MNPASLEKISSRDKELFDKFVWEWRRFIGGGTFEDLKNYLENVDMEEFVGADYGKQELDDLAAEREGVFASIKFIEGDDDDKVTMTVGEMVVSLLVKMAKAMFEGRKAKLGDDMRTREDWKNAVYNKIEDHPQAKLDDWHKIWSMNEWQMEVEKRAGNP